MQQSPQAAENADMTPAETKALNSHGYSVKSKKENQRTTCNFGTRTIERIHSEKFDQAVTIKVFDLSQVSNDVRSNYLPEEIELLKKSDHPHLAKFFEAFIVDNTLYVVMEYLSGGNLEDYVANRAPNGLTEDEVLDVFFQIVRVVKYCHKQKIDKRKIRCESFLLDGHRNVKLHGYGVWETFDRVTSDVGAVLYAAPEELKKEACSLQVMDMWSLGVVLFRMVTGRFPFYSHLPSELIEMQETQFYTIDVKRFLHITEQLKDLIAQLLTLDPKARITLNDFAGDPWMLKAEEAHHSQMKGEAAVGRSRAYEGENIGRPERTTKYIL